MFQPVVFDNGKYQIDNERRDRENHTQKLYWFTLSNSYIQSSVKPLSIHYATNHRLHIHQTQRGDFESHKAYSPSLHTTNTSSQNHTDFTGFYNSYTESYMNNYKNLNRIRKHLEIQYTRTLMRLSNKCMLDYVHKIFIGFTIMKLFHKEKLSLGNNTKACSFLLES